MVSLAWIRLANRGPDWWASLSELAMEIRVPRGTLYRALRRLAASELIGLTAQRNMGIWVWWIQTRIGQSIDHGLAPVWVIRDARSPRSALARVPIGQMLAWGDRRDIPRKTLHNWLSGRQILLRQRWEIVATPHGPVVGCDYAD